MKKKKKIVLKILRILAKVVGVILLLLLLIILFVRSPWGQNIIVNKAVSYIENKTNTNVEIDKLFVTFAGDIQLDGLFLEDKKGDTLVYSRSLEADIPLWPIISGNGIGIDEVDWQGLRANIIRNDSVNGFNYQFLIDAFVTQDSTTTAQDTTATAMNISLGDFHFEDFKVKYLDSVGGIDLDLDLSQFEASVDHTDLDNMDFRLSEIKLADTHVDFNQFKSVVDTTSTEESALPKLAIDDIELINVTANYNSILGGINSRVKIGEFLATKTDLNLPKTDYKLGKISLNNSDFLVETTVKDTVISSPKPQNLSQGFTWPAMNVAVDNIELANNNVEYYVNGAQPQKGKLNPNAIKLNDLSLSIDSVILENKHAGLTVNSLNFQEFSGINVRNFALDVNATDEEINVSDLMAAINGNTIKGDLDLKYSSLASFIETPENAFLDLDLQEIDVDINDVFLFQPDLKNNENLVKLAKNPVFGRLKASGKLADIQIPNLNINWGQNTSIVAAGSLQNATDPDNLTYNFPKVKIATRRSDLIQILDEQQLGLKLPDTITLSANVKGGTQSADALADLNTSMGNVHLDGNFDFGDAIAFNAEVEASNIEIGNLLQNDQLGDLNLTITTQGSGNTINNLDAQIDATVQKFTYNGYVINDLNLSGDISNGKGNLNSKYKDDNLNMNLNAAVVLDSVAPEANVNLDVIGADLQALGLASRNVKAALKLKADFKGNADSYDVNSSITEGVAVYDNQAYLLGDVDINAQVNPDTTSVNINNRIIDLNLESNASPAAFTTAIQNHIKTYLSNESRTDTLTRPVEVRVRGTINQTPILNEVLVANLRELDTVNIAVDFSEKKRELTANIDLPYVNYNGYTIDSLALNFDSNADHMNFDFGLNELDAGPVAIKKTIINGNVADKTLFLDFLSTYEGKKIVQMQSQFTRSNDTLRFHIVPDSLILNRNKWQVAANNRVEIADNSIVFRDFKIQRENQSFEVTNNMPNVEAEHIGLNFSNFNLATLLSYLNPEKKLATGNLNGSFIVEDPFNSPGMLADLNINDLNMMSVDMGTLSLNAESLGNENYDFNMAINGGEVDLDLTGNYKANTTAALLDLSLDINKISMSAAEGFSYGEVTNGSGNLSGSIKVTGTTADPQYDGELHFNKAGFKIAMLNEPFLLPDETVTLNNEGIYFDNFTVQDSTQNSFTVNGDILTDSFLNPSFDLNLKADNFQLLNSTAEDNDLFYGKASFDVDATITGDLNLPKVNLKLDVGSSTNVTYVVPASEVQVEARDGVVIFVNKENPDAILTQTQEKSYTVSGFEIDALLSVDEDAVFNIIIDEETGDNFQVKGEGDLNFNMYPNGRTTLTGRYDISDGHYEMSLYNLVKRRFEIADGSSVSWSGDIFDADLNVKAYYNVETSASALMAAQTSGSDISTRNRYKQVLPFLVYLNIDGEMMQPKINFNLDMPRDDRGAIGGQVYGRVQQLNQQENELNKQVFSLLVLNRFFPESGSDGSSGGAATIARDNLNQALSDQLNVASDKLLKDTGLELDFGLNSFTDYQGDAPQDRTTLDIAAQKKLLNDRLIVRVGSEVDIQGSAPDNSQSTPVIGNVSLEYLLTEDGRFRLQGFRRNEYENVIDGQLIVSGIALIFTREFNKFNELWNAILKEEEEATNEE